MIQFSEFSTSRAPDKKQAPLINKGIGGAVLGRANAAFGQFYECEAICDGLRQIAAVSACRCILRQITTFRDNLPMRIGSKDPVVEHKGSSDDVVDFAMKSVHARRLWASDDADHLSDACPTLCFLGEIASRSASVISFEVEGSIMRRRPDSPTSSTRVPTSV